MTLVVIGPVTKDLVVIGDKESFKTGGATYYQSFVFDKFYPDYISIVNCLDLNSVNEFPDSSKVKVIEKADTHFFINKYSEEDLNKRVQVSNFANIPILKSDLVNILPDEIDAFVLNPLNRHDFPVETIEFLKSFDVPIFISIQGFLRLPDVKVNENYAIKLEYFDGLTDILSGVTSIFLDEAEAKITGIDFDVGEIVITDGFRGSRIISDSQIKIDAVKCDEIVDTTGCGDTYMAAYISEKLLSKSSKEAGDFASLIASQKIKNYGHY